MERETGMASAAGTGGAAGDEDDAAEFTLLYDGGCRFCERSSRRLVALARRGAIARASCHRPGILDRFPQVTQEMCERALQLVHRDGRVYSGFEGITRAIATRRVIGWIAFIYYIPGIRHLCDWLYRIVARHRYRLGGRVSDSESCDVCRR